MLADNSGDILIKTDLDGYILYASPGIDQLGLLANSWLIGPHLLELIHPDFVDKVRAQLELARLGQTCEDWIEIPALAIDRGVHWYEFRARSLRDLNGRAYGVLGMMRSVQEKRELKESLFAAQQTDELTGLTNRAAFLFMLRQMIDKPIEGCVALFSLDYFKAINLRHGQSAGDELLVAFTGLLGSLTRQNDILSRVGGQTVGVLFPHATQEQAAIVCERVLETLARLGKTPHPHCIPVTASAGLCSIAATVDKTLGKADHALSLAKAKGGNRLEIFGSSFGNTGRLQSAV